jgi:hypothetical protein
LGVAFERPCRVAIAGDILVLAQTQGEGNIALRTVLDAVG